MSVEINYALWFAQVQARAAELEEELRRLRPLLDTLGALAALPDPTQLPLVNYSEGGREHAVGAYRNMSSPEAALDVLRTGPAVLTTDQIADAMLAGGFQTASKSLKNNVYSTLMRLQDKGCVQRVGKGRWSLGAAAAGTQSADKGEQVRGQAGRSNSDPLFGSADQELGPR